MLMKAILSAWVAAVVGVMITVSANGEKGELRPDGTNYVRYRPYVSGVLLPICLASWTVVLTVLNGPELTVQRLLRELVRITLTMTLYYGILFPLLPILRKKISARVCGMLWVLPTVMYIAVSGTTIWNRSLPRLVLPVPQAWIRWGGLLWIAGAAAVLGWNVLVHLKFRKSILARAIPVTDSRILEIWKGELERAGVDKAPYQLVSTPAVETPMSIGLLQKKIRVVLPEKTYSDEELTMLLRHELVHICRRDGENKFFLTFCKALCWFNPLMWVAMRKSADDMELSCDETVLAEADAVQRRKYADLLLTTAGEERGFTTCLSANAKAMRYRLKNVVVPGKRRLGAVLAGALVFVLLMSYGSITLSYGPGVGETYIFEGEAAAYSIRNVRLWDRAEERQLPGVFKQGEVQTIPGRNYRNYDCIDEEKLMTYLRELPMRRLAADCDVGEKGGTLDIDFEGADRFVEIRDRILTVNFYYGVHRKSESYWLEEPVDLELIAACIGPRE